MHDETNDVPKFQQKRILSCLISSRPECLLSPLVVSRLRIVPRIFPVGSIFRVIEALGVVSAVAGLGTLRVSARFAIIADGRLSVAGL